MSCVVKKRAVKTVGFSLALAMGLHSGVVSAATTGNVILSGAVPQKISIDVAGVSPYSNLDLSATQTDLPIANITEHSNSKTGYTVSVSSLHTGYLVNAVSGSVAYTAKYNGGSTLDLSTSQQITNQGTPGVYNAAKSFTISYTGAAPETMVEGTYSDTLTFTIAAK